MALAPATRLGAYEILTLLGSGGMGEVYRARDTKLNRGVALKILPDTFTHDSERLARFRREAQVLAAMNHPHIGAIYGLDEANGQQFLVLELVDGESLDKRIARGAIPVDEALVIARQIAEALEAAHEKGIIHRDLKPANIALTTDGNVKVLDFGLAKATEPASGASLDVTNSPTITTPAMMTGIGMILGTAAYMSPEQTKGRPADKRSDVWAFGCVLYEMLARKRAFAGEDVSDTLAAVLRADPDWTTLPPDVPVAVRLVLQRALEKDRRRRVGDMAAVLFVFGEPGIYDMARANERRQRWGRWHVAAGACAGAAVVALVAGLLWWISRSQPVRSPIISFTLPLSAGQRLTSAGRQVIAISPDGTHIAYVANGLLWIRAMSEREARAATSANDTGTPSVVAPTFSPDSQSVVFWSASGLSSASALKRIPIAGGTPVTICTVPANPYGITWAGDGIYYVQGSGRTGTVILRVSPQGGVPVRVAQSRSGELFYAPQVLPDGRGLLFTVADGIAPDRWDKAKIVVQLPSGEQKTIVNGGSDGRYVRSGHVLYVTGGIVFAVPFDVARLEVTGSPAPVIEGVARGTPASGAAQFSISDSGALVFVPGPPISTQSGRTLGIFSLTGDAVPLDMPVDAYEFPRVAPDGKRIAVGTNDGREANVWVYDLGAHTSRRRLAVGGKNRFPVWSNDSRRIAFQSDRDGDAGIFWQPADGSAPPERLTKAEAGTSHVPEAWSPQSDALLYSIVTQGRSSLWALSVGQRKSAPLANITSVSPITPVFSPDGRWLAYHTSEGPAPDYFARAGRDTVWVRPYPPTAANFEVTSDGTSHHPLWIDGGTRLMYIIGGGQVYARGISLRPAFAIGNPELLSALSIPTAPPASESRTFDLLPDGRIVSDTDPLLRAQRSVVGTAAAMQIDVVLNWLQELKTRVPTK